VENLLHIPNHALQVAWKYNLVFTSWENLNEEVFLMNELSVSIYISQDIFSTTLDLQFEGSHGLSVVAPILCPTQLLLLQTQLKPALCLL
jgi:hypothetical protein